MADFEPDLTLFRGHFEGQIFAMFGGLDLGIRLRYIKLPLQIARRNENSPLPNDRR